MLRQKWSRGQVEARFANMSPCLIGMEACVGAHHLSRKLMALRHDARLMPAKYVRPYSKGQKNDFRDAEAIAEAILTNGEAAIGPKGDVELACLAAEWREPPCRQLAKLPAPPAMIRRRRPDRGSAKAG